MSGLTETRRVLDSCACLGILAGTVAELPDVRDFVSVITRIELYAKPDLTDVEKRRIDALLADTVVVPLYGEVERLAVDIRRFGAPRPKLPDAIVAATAVMLNAPLVSQDDKMLKLTYPGLRVRAR